MITPNHDAKGDANVAELFQYDGPSPFIHRRSKPTELHHHHHNNNNTGVHGDDIFGPTTYGVEPNNNSMENHQFGSKPPITQHAPCAFDMSSTTNNNDASYNNDNISHQNGYHRNHHNNMRWPSLVSLPSTLGKTLKKGTHLISDSWREIKHLSHLDGTGTQQQPLPPAFGCQAPGTSSSSSSTLIYDTLMSELRDAMRMAEKRKDVREAETRKAKNLPDYSWLMDPTMRERRRYKMPHDEANQVNAMCWRVDAEDCNKVLRRFREHMEDDNCDDEPNAVPKIFMSILNAVIVEREQLLEERRLQERQKQHHHHQQQQQQQQLRTQSMADFGQDSAQQQQDKSWSEWLHEKFTGSMLNLSSLTGYGGLGNESASQSTRMTTASNRVAPTPMTTLHTQQQHSDDVDKTPVHVAAYQPPPPPTYERSSSVQSNATSTTYYDGDGGDTRFHPPQYQHSLQPSPRNASTASLYSNSSVDFWARPVGITPGSQRSLSTASSSQHANFAQLNPAALLMHAPEHMQQQPLTTTRANPPRRDNDDNDDDNEMGGKGGSESRRESTASSEDDVHMGAHDDESRQEYGGGWNPAATHDSGAVGAQAIVAHNERRSYNSATAANNKPYYY